MLLKVPPSIPPPAPPRSCADAGFAENNASAAAPIRNFVIVILL
jgi:hypothetical protein